MEKFKLTPEDRVHLYREFNANQYKEYVVAWGAAAVFAALAIAAFKFDCHALGFWLAIGATFCYMTNPKPINDEIQNVEDGINEARAELPEEEEE